MQGKIRMKTIIKYELVINEALRSALNYDIPDEQINEFIRFFGNHIGSDRIYIFEDDEVNHVTNNTYEWCAEGVIPEINVLQNVDMEVIRWWYETFSRGENVVITDLETIRDEYPRSYQMLKVQNVNNLVVCPIRYKDEIKGFFGVDNPPKSDYLGLTTFLDMIGTLLISLLKLRNSFMKSNREARLSSYLSLSKIYISMHLVNIQTQQFHVVKTIDQMKKSCNKDFQKEAEQEIQDDFGVHIRMAVEKFCTESQLEEMLRFVDITDVEERLHEKNTIAHEFIGKEAGWCRDRFIPVDYDENGRLLHVLYCIEGIEEEKKRENRLLYLAQTDLMTGICNRGSGEHRISELLQKKTGGLLCLLDCDKFKMINDTYGHSVGDKVIIALAETLQKSCRDQDVVMRLGGDEFAVYIPGLLNSKTAERFFQRLFENIRKISIAEMKQKNIVISLGACFYEGKESISFDQLYKKADIAMYQSKKHQGYWATIYGH